MNQKTTMDSTLESVLKDDLMRDIYLEATEQAEQPVKVYSKIAGLPNLGRTFFVNNSEIIEKHTWAWAQVMQKYGSEICGSDAALKGDGKTRADAPSFHGKQNESSGGSTFSGGLVECSVNFLMDIPQGGFFKESGEVLSVQDQWK